MSEEQEQTKQYTQVFPGVIVFLGKKLFIAPEPKSPTFPFGVYYLQNTYWELSLRCNDPDLVDGEYRSFTAVLDHSDGEAKSFKLEANGSSPHQALTKLEKLFEPLRCLLS